MATRAWALSGLALATLLALACDGAVVAAPQAAFAPTPAPGVAPATVSTAGEPDRLPPAVVPPLVRAGVRYAQADDGCALGASQAHGVLVATNVASGKRLWTLVVYPNPIDPKLEEDAQWVYFRSMAFEADGRLRIVDEAGRSWLVDVQRRTSTPAR